MEYKSLLVFVFEELKSRRLHKGKNISHEVITSIAYKLHVPESAIIMYIKELKNSGRIK